ncbi:MAG: YDG domain-containing protein, partial [Candidatus Fonsibacter sp.]
TIEARGVQLGGVVAVSKGFDGTRTAAVSGTPMLMGVVDGDLLGVSGTGLGQFETADPGERKLVSVSGYTLGGASSGNYVLELPRLKASIWGDVSGIRVAAGYG